MADTKQLTIEGVDPRIDGSYDFIEVMDWDHGDWHRVKKLTGLVFGDFLEADELQKFDLDIIYALAVIACDRAGVTKPELLLRRAKPGQIALPEGDVIEEEDDALPPEQQPVSEPASSGSDAENADDSTPTTNPHAVPPGLHPYLVSTGTQG